MSNRLLFTKLKINQVPGYEKGRPEIAEFDPGVNIIFGANGSGKSTTGRALQALLWPSKAGKSDKISGQFELDGQKWDVDLSKQNATWLINGILRDDGPSVIAAEQSKSYYLSLRDLLMDEDEDLAQRIADEMVGGYDISGAARKLNFGKEPPTAGIKECKKLTEVSAQRDNKQKQLQRLVDDASNLDNLKHQLNEAESASKRVKVLDVAIKYAQRRDDFIDKQSTVDACDTRLQKMTGNEKTEIDRLKDMRQNLSDRLKEYETKARTAKTEMEAVKLPEGGIVKSDIDRLSSYVGDLGRLDVEVEAVRKELAGSDEKLAKHRRRIGEAVTDEQLEKIFDPGEWAEQKEHARNAELLRSKRKAQEELKSILLSSKVSSVNEEDADAIEIGTSKLYEWLDAGVTKSSSPVWILVAASLVSACAAFVGQAILAGVLSGAGLVAFLVISRISRPKRDKYESAYKKMPIAQPSQWTRESVLDVLKELRKQAQSLTFNTLIDRRIKELRSIDENLKEEAVKLEMNSKDLQNRLGISVKDDESGMALLAETIKNWREDCNQQLKAQGTYDEVNKQRSDTIGKIKAAIAPYSDGECDDFASAQALTKDLQDRAAKYRDARRELGEAEGQINDATREIENVQSDIEKLFKKVDVDKGDEQELYRLVETREDYLEKCASKEKSKALADSSAAELTVIIEREIEALGSLSIARSLGETRTYFMDVRTDDLVSMREVQDTIANEYKTLSAKITEIETLVNRDKSSRELEAALASVEEARGTLRKHRTDCYASSAGKVLADYIEKMSRNDESAIFKRACFHFDQITRNSYDLQLHNGTFVAKEKNSGETKKLDELSDGTRVQLLLSVRLAFVENQEKGPKLPLFFDEALAITDDIRAPEVGQTIVEIAKTGRQVFYFTAQQDEIKKISECVNGGGISLETFTLNDSGSSNVLDNRAIVT